MLKFSKSVYDICTVSEYTQTHKPHICDLSANADIGINGIQNVVLQPGVLHRSLTNNAPIRFDINFYEKSYLQILMYTLSKLMSKFSQFRSAIVNRNCSACSPFQPSTAAFFKAVWKKLREAAKGLRQKVWTQTKILSPSRRY